MADFLKTQENIKTFISEKYPEYLTDKKTELKIDEFTDDSIDLDKHKKSNTVFFNFDSYNFSALSSDARQETISLKIYFVCRNDKESELKSRLLKLVSAFYSFFYDDTYGNESFNGNCSWAEITELNLFNEPEMKSAEISIELKLEEQTI